MDDFACHLLGAGVCESDRWRPPVATHQTENQGRTGIPTKVEGQAEERPEEAELTERPEEESNAMQTEGEEDLDIVTSFQQGDRLGSVSDERNWASWIVLPLRTGLPLRKHVLSRNDNDNDTFE